MSHLTGWQGERKRVRAQSARQNQWPQLTKQGPSWEIYCRWEAAQQFPSACVSACCRMCESSVGLPDSAARLGGFPGELCKAGEPSAPHFSQKEKGSTKWGEHSADTESAQGCWSQPKVWIMEIFFPWGILDTYSLCRFTEEKERSPPVLLTRKTLHLWLNTTWIMRRWRMGDYLDMNHCTPAQLFIYLYILLERWEWRTSPTQQKNAQHCQDWAQNWKCLKPGLGNILLNEIWVLRPMNGQERYLQIPRSFMW